MHGGWVRLFALALACGLAQTAHAVSVQYQVSHVAGATWEYGYVLENTSLFDGVEEFSIFFAPGLYQNLALPAAPTDWSPLVAQPDLSVPDDGFYDALALVAGIPLGGSLGGFSVRFDYLGVGTPGPQPFQILDPMSFEVLDSGTTTVVPVPPALGLMAASLVGVFGFGFRGRARRCHHPTNETATWHGAGGSDSRTSTSQSRA